jgi:hypothetical protein
MAKPIGAVMAALKFLSPKTGNVVDTEIDLDATSFARLLRVQ